LLAAAASAFEAALTRMGWTDDVLIQRLGALVDANTTLVAQKDGEFTDQIEVPDNRARQAAIHTMLQLKRAYPSTKIEVGGVVRVEQLYDVALRLESMTTERLAEIVDAEDAELLLTEGSRDAEVREADVPRLPPRSDPAPGNARLSELPRRDPDRLRDVLGPDDAPDLALPPDAGV
jgi:hypothetical protein